MSSEERALKWLKSTWPWSLDSDGPSEREVRSLAAQFDEATDELRSRLATIEGAVVKSILG